MSFFSAISDFFQAIYGPEPSDDSAVHARIQRLLDACNAQQSRIEELSLENLDLERRNAALIEREEAASLEMTKFLSATADPIPDTKDMVSKTFMECKVREEAEKWIANLAALGKAKDERFESEAAGWKMKYDAYADEVTSLVSDVERKMEVVRAAQQVAVSDVARLKKENAVLQQEIHLTVGDHKKERAAFEQYKKETYGWKSAFATMVRKEHEEERLETGKKVVEIMKKSQEACQMMVAAKDAAVEENVVLAKTNEVLRQEVADERLHRETAANIAQRMESELEQWRHNYELLRHESLSLKGINENKEKTDESLSDAHTAALQEVQDLTDKLDEMTTLVMDLEAALQTLTTDVEALFEDRDTLRLQSAKQASRLAALKEDHKECSQEKRELFSDLEKVFKECNTSRFIHEQICPSKAQLNKSLLRSEVERGTRAGNLGKAQSQRRDALLDQLGLSMVARLRHEDFAVFGEEIGMSDDKEAGGGYSVCEVVEEEGVEAGSNDLDLDEEEGDNEYDWEREYEVDLEYEFV